MPTISVRDSKGATVGELSLSAGVFERETNTGLMHQAVVVEEANNRQGTADTLTRGEVRGGGRKPWRQKGTGRARQGSRRAPHWTHGGIVFGPHPRSFNKSMPKKMRRAAIKCALSAKIADGELTVVDAIAMEAISTKKMAATLALLEATGRVLFVMEEQNEIIAKSSRNIAGLSLRVAPNLSVRDIINCDRIVMTKGAVEKMEEVYSK